MSVYDTTFVLNPQLEEAGLDQRVKEVVDLIGANGGTMVKENRLGMRKLAYEINKLTQGYYVSLVYEGEGNLVNELEHRFRMDDNCLRFLTCMYQEVTNVMESGFGDRHDRGYDRGHDRGHDRGYDRGHDRGRGGDRPRPPRQDARPDDSKSESKPEDKPEVKPEDKPVVKAEAAPEAAETKPVEETTPAVDEKKTDE